jgi:RND family efflux transporter MFP subunit
VQMLAVTGSLRAAPRAQVAAREGAAVESTHVDVGDLVKAGDALVSLDARRLTAILAEGEAALTAARAELMQRQAENERAEQDQIMMAGLWEQKAVAEREYLDSVSEAKVASSREDAARESIEAATKRLELIRVRQTDLEVVAPFDGRVVTRHIEIGEWLNEGDPVVTLVSTGEVEAWLQLPERHIAKFKADMPASVELRLPGRSEPILAKSFSLVPDVGGRSRRFDLIARIPDPDNRLTPGTSVQAEVPLGKLAERLVVASDAIMKGYAGSYVYTVEDSTSGPPVASRVPVEVLFERNGEAVLAEGALKPGVRVIVEGNERLFPKTPLNPQPYSEARPDGSTAGSAAAP